MRLLLLVFLIFIFTQETVAELKSNVRRHFLILYDSSYPFYSREEARPEIKRTLVDLFSNRIPKNATGQKNKLIVEQENKIPFFDPKQDEISFYFFGLTNSSTDYLFYSRTQLLIREQLFSEFTNRFIRSAGRKWTEYSGDKNSNISSYLNMLWDTKKPDWGNGYTLSNLVFPTVMQKVDSEYFATEYILIVISDFLTGADFGNKQDFGVIRGIFDDYALFYNKIFEGIEALNGKFYTIEYFDFEFKTGEARNGMPLLLGILGRKIRPNAGYFEPENITIKIDSDLSLAQKWYHQPFYKVSELIINFLHNDDLKIANISLEGRLNDSLIFTQRIVNWIDSEESALIDKENIKFDAAKRNYKIPAVTVRMPNILEKKDIHNQNLKFYYYFNSIFQLDDLHQVRFAYPVDRSIATNKITFASKLEVIAMSYLILLFIMVCILIVYIGKPIGIRLELGKLGDSFELIDYEKPEVGRVLLPYKGGLNDDLKLHVSTRIEYRYPGFIFNWRHFPISLSIKTLKCPKEVDIFLESTNGERCSEEYSLDISNDQGLAAFLVMNQLTGRKKDEVLEEIAVNVGARSRYKKIFIFKLDIRSIIDYSFLIGPRLSKVWVGLDPGTTGSCIASGSQTDNLCIQAVGREQTELITPSIIAFDRTAKFDAALRRDYSLLEKIEDMTLNRVYDFGTDAEGVRTHENYISFQSIKKLLGFKDAYTIQFKDSTTPLSFSGAELTSIIIYNIFRKHKNYILENKKRFEELLDEKGGFTPARAVLAIPNNATATKIQDFVNSTRQLNQFREIRCIYESEAAFIYYLFKIANKDELKNGLTGKTYLLFDMGGATINITLVQVTKKFVHQEPKYYVNVLAKLGYGVGGDTIDYCLIKLLFQFKKDYPDLAKLDPFISLSNLTPEQKEENILWRKRFMDVAFQLKLKIIENYPKGIEVERDKNMEVYLISPAIIKDILNDRLKEDLKLELDYDSQLMQSFKKEKKSGYKLFEEPNLRKYIYDTISSAVFDIKSFLPDVNIDKVIFSGRSVLFPKIKETVLNSINQEKRPEEFTFSPTELKTSVAKGACLYGINRNSIFLSQTKTSSTIGVKRTRDIGDVSYIKLIDFGQAFIPDGPARQIENVKEGPFSFSLDNNQVQFYQVMGTDAETILKSNQKHKLALLNRIDIDIPVQKVGVRLRENDDVFCSVVTKDGNIIRGKAQIKDQEIADANDEHYTWIVH